MTRPWTPRQAQDYYSKCLAEHGSGPQAVGWGSKESQELRFKVLVGVAGFPANMQGLSILDVGCGTGDLYEYLCWQNLACITYWGYDANRAAIDAARARFYDDPPSGCRAVFHPEDLSQWVAMPENPPPARWDYVLASGLFTFSNLREFGLFLRWMYRRARKALAFNVLSTWAAEHRPGHFYLEPSRALEVAARIQREVDGGPGRISLRHDYLPHDMTVGMYRNPLSGGAANGEA